MDKVGKKGQGATLRTRRHRWPRIIFCIVMSVSLLAQFVLEAFSRAMGLSCNVLAVMNDTPWFVCASSIILLFSTIYWGTSVALRAISYACGLHIINAGLINIVVHGSWGCILGENPSWIDVHPTPTGWMTMIFGILFMSMTWFLSSLAQRLERK
ncbi:hypothetical protein [Brevundimonas sp. SORGH_AS_0993]|uniref:hypothetical protein n=1 Tax=Brevundimonas sp. SORGH_AS_0993 TaxID=3041794 RepID=UPI002783E391|nr:hypothetical protein [Brevundimonas sp. SORGH_AS_0993]MDQ1153832.1 hypothetical protein [Brevundimonas sp. SORGH_AS_0993]